MRKLRKKVYFAAGYTTTFLGPGRPEFNPKKAMPSFEDYLKESAQGTLAQVPHPELDEGVLANYGSQQFLKQGNLPGFLPFAVPALKGKPCSRLEGACGSGGLALSLAAKSILSDMADSVFVLGFEIQNNMKSVYGADQLATAAYYGHDRKDGHAFFFPGIFSERAGAYAEKYGRDHARKGMAKWYELAVLNARKHPKAQEHHNATADLFAQGMTPPDPKKFLPHLNLYDCSKITDGAASLVVASEEGLKRMGIERKNAVELAGFHGAEGDITLKPESLTELDNCAIAARGALAVGGLQKSDIGLLELHDCFTISGLIALESLGFSEKGRGPEYVMAGKTRAEGELPTNVSGGLCGFGHPVGATGVRQMVDLLHQFTGKAAHPATLKKDHGMMVSMGGNDKTVTALVVRKTG